MNLGSFNGDGEITLLDYEEFFDFGPDKPSFVEWRASGEAFDVNGDGIIDQIDYEEFFDKDQTIECNTCHAGKLHFVTGG